MSKKTWAYILIGLAILVIILVYIYFKKNGKNAKLSDIINPVQKPTVPVPPRPTKGNNPSISPSNLSQPTQWIPESFPLDFGMYGNNTRLLQRSLNQQGATPTLAEDGRYGTETLGQVLTAGYFTPLVESDFDTITGASSSILPSFISGGTSADIGKTAYSNSNTSPIFTNDSNSTFLRYATTDESLGTVSSEDDTYYYINGDMQKVKKQDSYLG